MEHEYRITGMAAKKAVSDATNATKTLKTLTRRSAKITAKPKLVSKTKVPRASSMPSLLLAELAEKTGGRVADNSKLFGFVCSLHTSNINRDFLANT